MALPSSPPLLAVEESELPDSSTIGPLSRKRQLSDYGSLSSDPIFSDDTISDISQGAEYDEGPKRKRLVRGPWWRMARRGERGLRRDMAKKGAFRTADSGVWMGSDESDISTGSITGSQQHVSELRLDDAVEDDETMVEEIVDQESLAPRIIQSCLDAGRETVDLSDLGLRDLPGPMLRPLHQLIKSSFTDLTRPPSEDEFSPLTPSIQLFLSRNQLTSLPAELFALTNITVLSLRNNSLEQIPAAISHLHRLRELNISGNGVRHLPWELLDLLHCRGKHREVILRPNPLIEPCDLSGSSPLPKSSFTSFMKGEDLSRWADSRETYQTLRQRAAEATEGGSLSMRVELELRLKLGRMSRIQYLSEASRGGRELKLCREELIYLASSAVRFFDVDGTPIRRQGESFADNQDFASTLEPLANAPSVTGSASAPSLFELALRRLQTSANLPQDFLPQLPYPDLSATVNSALIRACSNAADFGNETCTACGRGFIIARARWVEYWYHGFPSQMELTPEAVLPFMRRACSWDCARPTEIGEFGG